MLKTHHVRIQTNRESALNNMDEHSFKICQKFEPEFENYN